MKYKLILLLPILCGIFLIACKNTTATPPEETSEKLQIEASTVFDDDLTEEDLNAPTVYYSASILKESEFSKKLEELVFYENPKTSGDELDENGHHVEFTKLYPLGWSKDGNFAWVTHSYTYDLGYQMTYTIQNMNTGDIIWNKQITYGMLEEGSEDEASEGAESHFVIQIKKGETEEQRFKYAWMAREAIVMETLEKAGIVPNPSGEFLQQPNYKDITFTVEGVEKEEDEENPNQYFLKSNKFDPKLIWKDYFPVHEMKVAGILKSPYRETIVVVCMQNRQLFEMTYVTVPILTGYKLD